MLSDLRLRGREARDDVKQIFKDQKSGKKLELVEIKLEEIHQHKAEIMTHSLNSSKEQSGEESRQSEALKSESWSADREQVCHSAAERN